MFVKLIINILACIPLVIIALAFLTNTITLIVFLTSNKLKHSSSIVYLTFIVVINYGTLFLWNIDHFLYTFFILNLFCCPPFLIFFFNLNIFRLKIISSIKIIIFQRFQPCHIFLLHLLNPIFKSPTHSLSNNILINPKQPNDC